MHACDLPRVMGIRANTDRCPLLCTGPDQAEHNLWIGTHIKPVDLQRHIRACCLRRKLCQFFVQCWREVRIGCTHAYRVADDIKIATIDCRAEQLEVAQPERLALCSGLWRVAL